MRMKYRKKKEDGVDARYCLASQLQIDDGDMWDASYSNFVHPFAYFFFVYWSFPPI